MKQVPPLTEESGFGHLKPWQHRLYRLLLPLAGFGSLVWFLVRVIPKPSRANYPCMKAAAPLAANFVITATAFLGSIVLFRKAGAFVRDTRFVLAALVLAGAVGLGVLAMAANPPASYGLTKLSDLEAPNQPVGQGRGIFPGRVVWVHNPDATNDPGVAKMWYDSESAPQAQVDAMFSRGIQALTGTTGDQAAWEALFGNFNQSRGRGGVGYAKGEKIVIKINLNGLGPGRSNINTSPQVCHALLDQLVNVVGVDPKDIHIGDPNISFDKTMYKSLFGDFPNVRYWGKGTGMVKPKNPGQRVIFASDGGKADPLPKEYLEASYMFNLPVLKKHHRAGISLTAKNHFGSITPFNGNGAFGWHYSLPVPDGGADNSNGDNGVYRCLVDFMGHEELGGKTILYLVDGLWGSINWGHPAIKWRMPPFNGDWPSSLFLSQDPVAMESVGFDFLYQEFGTDNPKEGRYDSRDDHGPFPHYEGVDDYIRQAASPANWPPGFVYDPEQDGSPLGSLGVHEHWNNATDKQYSRNLGRDEGIELLKVQGPWKN